MKESSLYCFLVKIERMEELMMVLRKKGRGDAVGVATLLYDRWRVVTAL
jgi:hypothetical protein